jgi:hypothetical protein
MASLTTRPKAKLYLGIPDSDSSDDALLDSLIIATTKRIEKLAGRIFCAGDYREWHNSNELPLRLKHHPLIRVNRVSWGCANGIEAEYTGTDIRANLSIYTGATQQPAGVRMSSMTAAGVTSSDLVTFATNPTLSSLATAMTAITDWTVTQVGSDAPSLDLHVQAGLDAKGKKVSLTWPDSDCPFHVDSEAGLIELPHLIDSQVNMGIPPEARPLRGFQMILADYRGGYDVIPADVEQVAHEFLRDLKASPGIVGGIQSENFGDYSYSLASQMDLTVSQLAIVRQYAEVL